MKGNFSALDNLIDKMGATETEWISEPVLSNKEKQLINSNIQNVDVIKRNLIKIGYSESSLSNSKSTVLIVDEIEKYIK